VPALRYGFALRPAPLLRATSGALLAWGFLPRDGSPANAIHRTFRSEAWREERFAGRTLLVAGTLLWLPATLGLSAYSLSRAGAGVKARTHKGLVRQALEQIGLSLRLGIPPIWYYVFDLHQDGLRARAHEYLYRVETKSGLYPFLRGYLTASATTDALRNKARFAQHCVTHGLPVVEALAVVESGVVTRRDGPDGPDGGTHGLPRRDLFVKALSGAGGRDAAVWRHRGDGSYASPAGEVVAEAELVARLEELSLDKGLVVRPLVSNHPEIAEITAGALSTVRVLSCLDEDGRPEVTHALLRMARASDVVVDNFHAGGIASKVDLASGILRAAVDRGLRRDAGPWDVHPLTHGRISGRRLPLWDAVLELARRAHATFPDQVAVGWDIAILADGPRLIEGNKSPDLDIVQRTHGEPIGNSRFGELLAFHVGRALERKYARVASKRRIEGMDPSAPLLDPAREPAEAGRTAEVYEIPSGAGLAASEGRTKVREALEGGGILFLPKRGFALTATERELLRSARFTSRRDGEEEGNGRPTILFDPRSGKLEHARLRRAEWGLLVAMMDRFSRWAQDLVAELLPSYVDGMERDRVTFRPCGRSVPQGLHVDSSYGHPTQGRAMLRVFCNVHPDGGPRRWQIGEPFEDAARRFVRPGSLSTAATRSAWLANRVGFTKGRRSSYDRAMAELRRTIKSSVDYQQHSPRRVVEFPSGSSWVALTDLVLHGALSGRYSLDQTFYLPATAMQDAARSSLRILERLGECVLA
jgi:hypothetical protein